MDTYTTVYMTLRNLGSTASFGLYGIRHKTMTDIENSINTLNQAEFEVILLGNNLPTQFGLYILRNFNALV